MDQLRTLWLSMDPRRRVIAVVATLAMFAAVIGLSRLATTPSSALLFSGLDGAASGEVVAQLEQRGVEYSVRGSAIYVPAPQRDELRMALAAEGLPANSAAGYELLDTLSGFGTTSQMFDAAHWRAVEGELARTILASPQIRAARVHISRDSRSGLRRDNPRTASATVTGTNGSISAAQARALRFLIASAVGGLTPDKVSIIDGLSGTVFSDAESERANQTADSRTEALKRNVERLLEARVGPGNVVVEVAIDAVTETETITERVVDPDSRVAISTETEENSLDATEPTPGVTVASNLPTGDAAAGAAGRSQNNQTRERTNYEVSETQTQTLRAPGAIRSLSVAVLVNAVDIVGQDGQATAEPRDADELEDLRLLVASAVGFNEARGDVITIRSMPFEPVPQLGTEGDPGIFQRLNIDVMLIIQLLVLAGVILGLGFGVVRPIAAQAASLPPPAPPAIAPPDIQDLPVLSGEIDPAPAQAGLAAAAPDAAAAASPGEVSSLSDIVEDPVDRLRQLIEDRKDETVDILRDWMERDEEVA